LWEPALPAIGFMGTSRACPGNRYLGPRRVRSRLINRGHGPLQHSPARPAPTMNPLQQSPARPAPTMNPFLQVTQDGGIDFNGVPQVLQAQVFVFAVLVVVVVRDGQNEHGSAGFFLDQVKRQAATHGR